MCKPGNDKLSSRLELKYLKNLVERVFRAELEVFDGDATSQILSFANVREPSGTANVTDTYKLLPQKI